MQICAISEPNSAFDIKQPVTMSESSSARHANDDNARIAARIIVFICDCCNWTTAAWAPAKTRNSGRVCIGYAGRRWQTTQQGKVPPVGNFDCELDVPFDRLNG